MARFFIRLYDFLERHKLLFYVSLVVVMAMMAIFATQVRFDENIMQIFPHRDHTTQLVFDSLKVKDRIAVMVSKDGAPNVERMSQAVDSIEQNLRIRLGDDATEFVARIETMDYVGRFRALYAYLPLFLSDSDYVAMDRLLAPAAIDSCMAENYAMLLTPEGSIAAPFIAADPLGLGAGMRSQLFDFLPSDNFIVCDNHLCTADSTTMLLFITPRYGVGETGRNRRMVRALNDVMQQAKHVYPDLRISCFSGASVGVANADQVRKDVALTLTVALVIISLFVVAVFRRKSTLLLLLLPVAFGVLFALCCIYFIKGSVSAISVGIGATVLGIALNYSIHFFAHQSYVRTIRQLIGELAAPLTIGSFTTIGAFVALLFTSSALLRDFGLFAALALVGTTLFCLVWLPHFLQGECDMPQGRVMLWIERVVNYPYERNYWLLGGIVLLFVVGLFTSRRVSFDSDISHLNYEPEPLQQAERQLAALVHDSVDNVTFVAFGETRDSAIVRYRHLITQFTTLQNRGEVRHVTSINRWLLTQAEQQERLQRWNDFWTDAHREAFRKGMRMAAIHYGLRPEMFTDCYAADYVPYDYADSTLPLGALLENQLQTNDGLTMIVAQAALAKANKSAVYGCLEHEEGIVVFDRGYYANRWIEDLNGDFYLILLLSSCLVFVALFLCYGRLELTLLSFLPMCVSWVIIVGLMGLFGLQFNIVSIVLATFIFGIGDDFSIFIMDGLIQRYRTQRELLGAHKTAIFFSAFTIFVGLGVMILAKHPALRSVAVLAFFGMVTVVLVAFTLQPILFRLLVIRPTEQGHAPFTLWTLLRAVLVFLCFLAECIVAHLVLLLLLPLPMSKRIKQRVMGYVLHHAARLTLFTFDFGMRHTYENIKGRSLGKPAIVVANHQSIIDILLLLALTPKIKIVVKDWVLHVPLFGLLLRYAGFYNISSVLNNVGHLRAFVADGYSVALFPEGTRFNDGRVHRLHKGAFYLAEQLQVDIVPVAIYGTGHVLPKGWPICLNRGQIACRLLPRIERTALTPEYHVLCRQTGQLLQHEVTLLEARYANTSDSYFRTQTIMNFIYKGSFEALRARAELFKYRNYGPLHDTLPRQGRITCIGCGCGAMALMLGSMAPARQITFVCGDTDSQALLQYTFGRRLNMQFVYANAVCYKLPESDAFVVGGEMQRPEVLQYCITRLHAGGSMLDEKGNRLP